MFPRLLIALPLFAAIALAVPPEEPKKKPPASAGRNAPARCRHSR